MFITQSLTRSTVHLPRLAAAVVICLGLSTNTHVDAANTSAAAVTTVLISNANAATTGNTLPPQLRILSPKDEGLYRAIFAAQDKGNWAAADAATGGLANKSLIGHVLAERLLRQPSGLSDYKLWLTAYATYPEADDIYDMARKQPSAKGVKFTKPANTNEWSGVGGGSGAFGFRNDRDTIAISPVAKSFAHKLDVELRHGDPYTAKALLQTEQARRRMIPAELADAQGRIAASFFYEGNADEARKLAAEAARNGDQLGGWIAGLATWKQNDPAAASVYFARLAANPDLSTRDRSAASFWAYRSLKRFGSAQQAGYWLRQAAQEPRSYYGIMATQLLGSKGAWSWQMPDLTHENIAAISQHPAAARALALVQVGRNDLAEDELRHLDPRGKHALQEAMLNVASAGNMPALSMQLGGLVTTSEGKYYDAALYPVPNWQPTQGFRVDRALIYALIKHESQFDPTAVSGRGACGLMQLMPATAKLAANDETETLTKVSANDNRNQRSCADHLLDPSVNMTIGQNYVRYLAEQPAISDNLVLLLAAYNSGPGKVARWMDEDSLRRDPLLFIESMPVRETREYIQQVMVYYWTYNARLGQPQTALSQLARGEWPRYAMTKPALPKKQASVTTGFELASATR